MAVTEMDKKIFIEKIAPYVVKHAPEYGIKVCSPIIAQAILESGWGTTDKASHNNFFGIKYHENRCPSACGAFSSSSYEQKADGSYYPIITLWCDFLTVEDGIKGYFEFLENSSGRYRNVKGITDPREYLSLLRSDGYATSLNYVENVMRVVNQNGLTVYDGVETVQEAPYTFKTNYALKGNYGAYRGAPTSDYYIVIHYTANDGDTDEGNGNYFASKLVSASAHYFVDDDSVTQSVPDDYTAWSVGGSRWTDYKTTGGAKLYGIAKNANTINVELCDTVKNGVIYPTEATIRNAAYLVKSLMQKYGIRIDHVIRHFDVNGKHCPAYWMEDERFQAEFLDRVGGTASTVVPAKQKIYKVQSGAFKVKLNATNHQAKLKKAGFDTFIVQTGGYYKVQTGAYSVKTNATAQKNKLLAKGFAAIIIEV